MAATRPSGQTTRRRRRRTTGGSDGRPGRPDEGDRLEPPKRTEPEGQRHETCEKTTVSLARADERAVAEGASALAAADPELRALLDRLGPPPLWAREPGFATLVHMILEQQVSLASAAAAMTRLRDAIGPPEPRALLALDDERMLAIGFSRQKRGYARDLARRVLDGRLRLGELEALPDSEVVDRLTEVKGIGRWTADVYLLMALGRLDVWPIGDRALVVAARRLRGLERDPGPEEMMALGETWRPRRSIAARMLWQLYLTDIRPAGARARGGGRAS